MVANPTIAPLAIRLKMAGGVLYFGHMKKFVWFLILSAALAFAPASSFASPNKASTSGTCLNGASWTMTATRSGDKVTATFVATKMPFQQWNINWAWTPSNTVANFSDTPKKGKLLSTNSTRSKEPVTAYVWVDEPWAYAFTCVASITM